MAPKLSTDIKSSGLEIYIPHSHVLKIVVVLKGSDLEGENFVSRQPLSHESHVTKQSNF